MKPFHTLFLSSVLLFCPMLFADEGRTVRIDLGLPQATFSECDSVPLHIYVRNDGDTPAWIPFAYSAVEQGMGVTVMNLSTGKVLPFVRKFWACGGTLPGKYVEPEETVLLSLDLSESFGEFSSTCFDDLRPGKYRVSLGFLGVQAENQVTFDVIPLAKSDLDVFQAHNAVGDTATSMESFENHYRNAKAANPKSPFVKRWALNLLSLSDDPEELESLAKELVRRHPNNAEIIPAIGYLIETMDSDEFVRFMMETQAELCGDPNADTFNLFDFEAVWRRAVAGYLDDRQSSLLPSYMDGRDWDGSN